jgi:phosphoribosylamine--glycine ligase
MLAAQLEGSKQFAKEFMQRHGIPTARFSAFSDAQAAKLFVRDMPLPIVIKADGLAAGKGVVIAESLAEAERVIDDMLSGQAFGEAGSRVVIEEFLPGEEASYIVISDGERTAAFATSQDHKRVGDDDQGPNTGGMGAYSPAPVVTRAVADRVERDIIAPVIRGMRSEGLCYQGFLYAGLMIDALGQPKVVEFNCRFGDPETQPILMRLNEDFAGLCMAAAKGHLRGVPLHFSDEPAVTVVMASEGYPSQPRTGDPISGLEDIQVGKVFHAGTRFEGDQVVTSGGRVLGVTAMGRDLAEAQTRVYDGVRKIQFEGCHYRTDIGFRALTS